MSRDLARFNNRIRFIGFGLFYDMIIRFEFFYPCTFIEDR